MKSSWETGHTVRIDDAAESARPDLPAFLAAPEIAPAYHGFPLLANSEKDGFAFGVITEPVGAHWGDAFVVAPDGSRAGIVWQTEGDPEPIVCAPSPGRWGVYAFRFTSPSSEQDLIRQLHSVLPELKRYYLTVVSRHPGADR